MKHDFPFEPDIRVEALQPRSWRPELVAIVAIFITVWAALLVHYLSDSTGW
ncbi:MULTISPECIES: hypothetical protein [Sphingomonadaceae]|nr:MULTISPECIES: hypothetical protein [Sphingomonadaceae]